MRKSLFLLIGIVFWSGMVSAQDDSSWTEEYLGEEVFNDFDTMLIPCTDLYSFNWSHLSVGYRDLEANNHVGSSLTLILRDSSDCFYQHPHYGKINSDFGWRWNRMHYGVDIDLQTGDPVMAAFDGVIRISKVNPGGFGNYIVIRHYNGLETLYGHLSERLVDVNQTVRAGDVIGYGGSTGRSTGPHLHFETRFLGKPINPQKIICFEDKDLKQDSLLIEKNLFDYASYYSSKYKTASKSANSRQLYHKVKSGDTLSGIARKYGTSVTALCKLNRISKNAVLPLGKRLQVK